MNTITKFFALAVVMLGGLQAPAQFCTNDDRFTNSNFFSEEEIDSSTNAIYGNAVNWEGESEVLEIDYYFPSADVDPLESRPFILLIHGGGFQGGDKSDLVDECLEFAKRGYVAATIKYRLGYDPSIKGDNLKALYRAHQDANAALRYSAEIANSIGIDTSWVFVGGGSAGAITALFASYVDEEEYTGFYPAINSILGSLNDSGNDFTHSISIKGIYNNWGSCSPSATQPEEMKPMISFHGALDNVVPIEEASTGLVGSLTLHNMSIDAGVCSQLNIDPNGGHVIYDSPEETIFRVAKACCFFKSVFCEECENELTDTYDPAECASTTSTQEGIELNEISAFPIPFSDQLHFKGLNGTETFCLYDSQAHLLFKGNEKPDFKKLNPGIYILNIVRDLGSQSIRLYKQQ